VVTDATNSQESATIPVTIAYKTRHSYHETRTREVVCDLAVSDIISDH